MVAFQLYPTVLQALRITTAHSAYMCPLRREGGLWPTQAGRIIVFTFGSVGVSFSLSCKSPLVRLWRLCLFTYRRARCL